MCLCSARHIDRITALLWTMQGRGVLDLPLAWVQPDLRRHMKREANRLAKLWECVSAHLVGQGSDRMLTHTLLNLQE